MKAKFPTTGRSEHYEQQRAWAAEVEKTIAAQEKRIADLEKALEKAEAPVSDTKE